MSRKSMMGSLVAGAVLGAVGPAAGQCEPPPPVKVTAPDPQPNQYFGGAVAISGDLMAVGARSDSDNGVAAGAVYIYGRENGAWVLRNKILAPDGEKVDQFGTSLDLKGELLVVGAPGVKSYTGAVYVFRQEAGVWKQEKMLPGNAGHESYFGEAVAVDADIPDALLVVGEPKYFGLGAAYLYRRGQGEWSPVATLTALDGANNDRFGNSVDVEDGVAVVGAYIHSAFRGAVYVYRDTGVEWVQEQELMAPDGFDFQGFGLSLSLSLPLVLVGTESFDEVGEYFPGAAYVFAHTDAGWQEEVAFKSPAGLDDDEFGYSVSLRGGLALVGAPNDRAAYSFAQTGQGQWNFHQTFRPDDPKSVDFGGAVNLGADAALIGDVLYDPQAGHPGAAFVADLCPPPCDADFDADGTLTIFDFLAFVNAFNELDARADCDQNGQWDLFDFLCFVNAFNEGCG